MIPKGVKAMVGHLQHAANVGGLSLVEKEVGGRSVCVEVVAAFQKTECHKSIEEIARGARMQPESSLQGFQILRMFCQFREQFHLDSAQ